MWGCARKVMRGERENKNCTKEKRRKEEGCNFAALIRMPNIDGIDLNFNMLFVRSRAMN